MMYIDYNSCPDIQFAINQCARLTENYQASHEDTILCIWRYLKGTQKKGLILSLNRKLHVNCYVDSDFAGLFSYEDPHDPVWAGSR